MTFADLALGESVFLDANPLVYHFAPDPLLGLACHQLVSRMGNNELRAFTSTHVLSEVAHHLMTLEASAVFGWTSKVVEHLKQQPASIQKLTNFRQVMEKIPYLSVQILTIPVGLIATAAAISQQCGLLSNDALIVAIMQSNGLTCLASNDSDFDRVPGITRYSPIGVLGFSHSRTSHSFVTRGIGLSLSGYTMLN